MILFVLEDVSGTDLRAHFLEVLGTVKVKNTSYLYEFPLISNIRLGLQVKLMKNWNHTYNKYTRSVILLSNTYCTWKNTEEWINYAAHTYYIFPKSREISLRSRGKSIDLELNKNEKNDKEA